MAILQETFRNAVHSGYLRIKEKKAFLFGSNNTEYFMILTNLGILYFKSFGKIKPHGFIPILGSNLKLAISPNKDSLLSASAITDPKKFFRFSIEYPKLNFRLQASS